MVRDPFGTLLNSLLDRYRPDGGATRQLQPIRSGAVRRQPAAIMRGTAVSRRYSADGRVHLP